MKSDKLHNTLYRAKEITKEDFSKVNKIIKVNKVIKQNGYYIYEFWKQ